MFSAFSTHFQQVLFAVTFLLRLDSLASKPAFVIKFSCADLPLKALEVKVLNCGVVINLSSSWSASFFSSSLILCHSVFLPRLFTLGILFSTAGNAVLLAKLPTSGF